MPTFSSLHDARRLPELRSLAIIDTPPEQDYDDVAALASAVCASPVAAVNFVDDKRHFTKAIIGMPKAVGGSVPNDVSFCAATIREADGLLMVTDTHAENRWRDHPLVVDGPQVRFYAGVSIEHAGERVGVVCAFGPEPREINDVQRSALMTLARQATSHLDLRRRNAHLREMAITDPLTGLANRTLLFDRIELALADGLRTNRRVGLLFCDVDNFKRVNDRYGHEAGDRLLCDTADHLRTTARETDTVARIAGDEFVLLCPGLSSIAQAHQVAARINQSDGLRPMPDGSPPPRLSVGVVLAREGEQAADVLRRADAEMYVAKSTLRR